MDGCFPCAPKPPAYCIPLNPCTHHERCRDHDRLNASCRGWPWHPAMQQVSCNLRDYKPAAGANHGTQLCSRWTHNLRDYKPAAGANPGTQLIYPQPTRLQASCRGRPWHPAVWQVSCNLLYETTSKLQGLTLAPSCAAGVLQPTRLQASCRGQPWHPAMWQVYPQPTRLQGPTLAPGCKASTSIDACNWGSYVASCRVILGWTWRLWGGGRDGGKASSSFIGIPIPKKGSETMEAEEEMDVPISLHVQDWFGKVWEWPK